MLRRRVALNLGRPQQIGGAAGTGIGGVFNLGVTNSVNGTTTLTGNQNGPMLKVVNTKRRQRPDCALIRRAYDVG